MEIRWRMFRSSAVYLLFLVLLPGLSKGPRAQEASQSQTNSEARILDVPSEPDFGRDVQPIFASACGACHGGVKQAADISFVDPTTVLPPEGWAIEPGDPDNSELLLRIESTDPDLRMPPPDEHPEGLTPQQVETIRKWIAQGANWTDHWSRMPLVAPPTPKVANNWSREPLDAFVQAMHERNNLSHAEEAEPEQWLRRVYLDLIGLPPSLQEIERFTQGLLTSHSSPERELMYAREVDRLLASPHFGERWATVWMDLARYADSKGYEKDPHRDMWPYRDWLIRAFNADMPFDQFTIKQLAGDLLPKSTFQDLVATAFHRNTQTNTEGGTDDEEFRTAAVIDRLNTTWTVWQATTFGCVQCHAHPYEPFRNQDFYAGLAIFNNTEDCDLDSEFPTLPYIEDIDQQSQWNGWSKRREDLLQQLDRVGQRLVAAADWYPLPISSVESTSGTLNRKGEEIRSSGTISVGTTYLLNAKPAMLTALRLHILPVSDSPSDWPEQGSVLSQLELFVLSKDGQSQRKVELAEVIPDHRDGPYEPEQSLESGRQGFGGYPKLFGPRWLVVTLAEPLKLEPEQSLQVKLHQKSSVTGGLSNHLRRFRVEYAKARTLVDLNNAPERKRIASKLEQVDEQLAAIEGPNLPIIRERGESAARETRRFIRGNFLEKAEVVEPGLPGIFADEAGLRVSDRLEFARWLVSEKNPLAARVWANRIWAELFGVGIVETLEDFGSSGAGPIDQPLLDHLAYTLQHRYAWHLKPTLRSIVLSATYRQDSRMTEKKRSDPKNRLLARGPRTRLTAEMVRDQALVAAGKLDATLGGPSVMPPQPEGIWQQAYSASKWKDAIGGDRYRRGLYTYWKRTSPYPGFIMFDAPTRDVCSARRLTTNTPLQALVTLNSEVYTELAEALAEQCASESDDLVEIVASMFLRVTSRQPAKIDVQSLLSLYHSVASEDSSEVLTVESEANVSDEAAVAERSQRSVAGDSSSIDKQALTTVALAILNSDWALTK